MSSIVSALALGAALCVVGCGGSPAAASSPTGAPAEAPRTFSEQVALGQKLFGEKCAGCHGSSGQGGEGPPVVGLTKGALPLDPPPTSKFRKTQFKTVADIANFAVKAMPPDAPGSLSPDAYWSILAFDLKANGIDLGDKKLDGALAATLDVPR